MSEIDFYLKPSPTQPPEFLATVQPIIDDTTDSCIDLWNEIRTNVMKSSNPRIVLEDYTRDTWTWKPNTNNSNTSNALNDIKLKSIYKRNKLIGFIQYLKDRQKSAYGRIYSGDGTTSIAVVSYLQPKQQLTTTDNGNYIVCRLCPDITKIPNCTIKPLIQNKQQQQPNASSSSSTQSKNQNTNVSSSTSSTAAAVGAVGSAKNSNKKKSGFLGKLVGAQQRTNISVAVSNAKTQPRQQQQQKSAAGVSNDSNNNQNDNSNVLQDQPLEEAATKTAQEVFIEFRQFCQDQMLDFDMNDDEDVMKIPIELSEYVSDLAVTEKPKVTLEILKYMIIEAAEETNDEWIAVKEPSEFIDEMTIVIYKAGAAPVDVLEDMNKGELPDEIIGQQRALTEQRNKLIEQTMMKQQQKQQAEMLKKNNQYSNGDDDNDDDDEDEIAALNTKKRDRRTFEDYQRDKQRAT